MNEGKDKEEKKGEEEGEEEGKKKRHVAWGKRDPKLQDIVPKAK